MFSLKKAISKKHILLITLLITVSSLFAQTKIQWALWQDRECGVPDSMIYKKNYTKELSNINYLPIWTCIENSMIFGFIGDNYQRVQIKFISVKKDSINPLVYLVSGKSKVSNHICAFNGKITINYIRCIKPSKDWPDAKKRGILFGEYCFYEDSTQRASGIFKGSFASSWFITNKGMLAYDSLAAVCDMFGNNQFAGTWKSYRNNITKTCNWGDFRIPFSGKLDIGAGFFSPADEYLQFGWQNLRNTIVDGDEKAQKKELQEWWK